MSAPSLFISRGNRGISPTFALRCCNLRNLRCPPPLAELKEGSAPPPSLPPPPALSISPTASAMPPKPGKGKATKAAAAKAVKSTEVQRLEALRKERATFPPELSAKELREWYYLFWSMETRAHPRTKVLSAVATQAAPVGGYPFFAVFFYRGLCPPFSDFFCDIMNTYGFHLLDFTPNVVLTMAVFAHLCKNFVGVHANVALFRHFFMP